MRMTWPGWTHRVCAHAHATYDGCIPLLLRLLFPPPPGALPPFTAFSSSTIEPPSLPPSNAYSPTVHPLLSPFLTQRTLPTLPPSPLLSHCPTPALIECPATTQCVCRPIAQVTTPPHARTQLHLNLKGYLLTT